MKITKIECIPITIPIKQRVVMSGGPLLGSTLVLVKMHTDEGITGIADSGGTSEWYGGDTQEAIMAMINSYFGPQALLGEDPFKIEKIVARMDKIAKHNNQAKAVVDYGLTIEKIPHGYVVAADNTREMVAESLRGVEAGFKVIKIKVGYLDAKGDIENVRAIREAVGSDIKLTIDPNGGWNFYQALDILRRMEQFDIALVEQPVPWWDIDGMANLRKKVGIPIFPDESAAELRHLLDIIQKGAADGLALKIAKAGGLLKAKKWIAIAKAADLPVMCGCMTGSGFEAAVGAHLLASDEWTTKMEHENLGPIHMSSALDTAKAPITTDLAKNVPRYENGFLYPPHGPGIGCELNEEMVTKLMSPGKSPTVIGI
jgi:L-alanine-DL-glutamate epimerase-like enolase superfamily enzyme